MGPILAAYYLWKAASAAFLRLCHRFRAARHKLINVGLMEQLCTTDRMYRYRRQALRVGAIDWERGLPVEEVCSIHKRSVALGTYTVFTYHQH
jgi:meiotically up-regulated gene 157 (Mug157) protein